MDQIIFPNDSSADSESDLNFLLTNMPKDVSNNTETTRDKNTPVNVPNTEEFVGGDYEKRSLDELLQEKSLEAEYLSPQYLRQPLLDFIDQQERGVFWLRAPAHMGKSLFVHGLPPKNGLEDEPL